MQGRRTRKSFQMQTGEAQDITPMLIYGWYSVVDGGPTINQQWEYVSCLKQETSNTRHYSNVDLLLGQRHRRWAKNRSTLETRVVSGIVVLSQPLEL